MRTARVSVPGAAGVMTAEVQNEGERLQVGGRSLRASEVRFEPATEGLVYGVILNDARGLQALGPKLREAPYRAPPQAPVLYIKPWNTHAGHGAQVVLPRGAQRVDVFGALGIVFGRQATRVSQPDALDAVAGYTVVADYSLPQKDFYRPPIREKCFDGSCPVGPWVVDRAVIADPASLEVRVHVNDELRQRRRLADLVRSVPKLIADVTDFLTLYPGDLLLAGVPFEAPSACAGDRVAVEIPGVGRLENLLEAPE